MRAMAVVEYGRPLVELDLPLPELVPGSARLQVLACGVCFSDVKTARGEMPFSAELRLPHVPGHEVCGRVLETDPPNALPEGATVLAYHYWPCGNCTWCRSGAEQLCADLRAWMGFTHPGGFQEQLVVPLDRLFRVSDTINPVLAAPMSCALGTAYRATVTRGAVRAGSTVAVIGIGGVGIHALQIARAAGALVVGLDISDRALEAAREMGFEAHSVTSTTHGFMRDLTDGRGFDVVINTVGSSDAFAQAAAIVRRGGRVVGVGYASSSALSIATPRFVLDEIELLGSRYVTRAELERAIALVAEGAVEPVIDLTEPLAAVNDVFAALLSGQVVGRAVLEVSSTPSS